MPKGYVEDVLESKNNSTYLKPIPLNLYKKNRRKTFAITLMFFSKVCPRSPLTYTRRTEGRHLP